MAYFVIPVYDNNSSFQIITTKKVVRTLAIETSCDDTSVSIVVYNNGNFVVEKIMAYSQIPIHQKRWWVVPELAARSHSEKIIVLLDALEIDSKSIDTISVTAYPWLPWALVVWVTSAYMLWAMWKKPVIEVNHIMGHVFSVLAWRSLDLLVLPYVCLTVSWGHNDIYLVEEKTDSALELGNVEQRSKRNHMAIGESINVWKYRVKKIAQSTDDAAGEAFDKVSRMLWWPYPWGKWVSEYWENNDAVLPKELPIPVCKKWLFSFSWLKSQVHTIVRKITEESTDDIVLENQKKRIAYDFQEVVAQSLVRGLQHFVKKYNAKTIWIVWWVSANSRLRSLGKEQLWLVYFPKNFDYCTDNAAMIWVVWLLQSLWS